MGVEPRDDLFIRRARGEELFNFVGLHALEFEEPLVERAGVVILANGACDIGAAFVDRARQEGVASKAIAGLRGASFVRFVEVLIFLIG